MYKYLGSNLLSTPLSVLDSYYYGNTQSLPFTMSQKHAPPTGTSSTGIPWFNFSGYDDHGLISAATLIPPNRRIVFTSGQVGTDSEGKQPETLEDEMILAFEVINASADIKPSRMLIYPNRKLRNLSKLWILLSLPRRSGTLFIRSARLMRMGSADGNRGSSRKGEKFRGGDVASQGSSDLYESEFCCKRP